MVTENFLIWPTLNFKNKLFLSLLFFTSVSTKRAQLPFSAWLPAAISAPTPISSLVHSSTLVTAGVFLFFQFPIFYSRYRFYLGFITTLIARLSACFEIDGKKIIALSTLRHLGIIIYNY